VTSESSSTIALQTIADKGVPGESLVHVQDGSEIYIREVDTDSRLREAAAAQEALAVEHSQRMEQQLQV